MSRFCVLFLLMSLFVGCRQGPSAERPLPTIASTVAPATSPPVSATPRSPTSTRSLPTATSTLAPTPQPTRTPTRPAPLRLGVPAQWEARVRAVMAEIDPGPDWQLLVTEDAEGLLEAGDIDAALVAGEEGYYASSIPLALAVPFATDWDEVTLAQARDIQANGHELVSLLPWGQLSAAQRALLVDGWHVSEAGYPLQQAWSITARQEASEPAQHLARRLQETPALRDVKLAAVGDIMLDRALGEAIASGDTAFPFAYVAAILQDANLTLGNLESAIGDVGQPANKSYAFRAPPQAAHSLAEAGFDLVSLANNHAMDYGPQALLQGISLLAEADIATVGAGANVTDAHRAHIVEAEGILLGFLGYVHVPVEGRAPYFDTSSWTAGPQSPGLAWANPDVVAGDVRVLREQVDHVIIILHSGYEYVPAPSPEQVTAARAAIDAGASLVIGHHAHILQRVEFRDDGVIVYGLGNFAFNITGPPQTAILNVWLDKQGVRQLRFIPAIIQGSGQPAPADKPNAAMIRGQIYALSRSFN